MQQQEPDGSAKAQLPKLSALQERQEVADTPGTPVFDAKNVSICYGSFQAVTDVSLTIYEHEITAFIGSSGSGKTTMLRAFNRMNDLVAGSRMEGDIYYAECRCTALVSRRSRCGGTSAWSSRSRTRSRSRSMTTSPTGRASTASTTSASWMRSSSTHCARPRCGTR